MYVPRYMCRLFNLNISHPIHLKNYQMSFPKQRDHSDNTVGHIFIYVCLHIFMFHSFYVIVNRSNI